MPYTWTWTKDPKLHLHRIWDKIPSKLLDMPIAEEVNVFAERLWVGELHFWKVLWTLAECPGDKTRWYFTQEEHSTLRLLNMIWKGWALSFTHLTINTLILAVETSFSRWSVDFHPHACNKIFGIKIDLSNGQTTTFQAHGDQAFSKWEFTICYISFRPAKNTPKST